jgi:L,D-peptidoglycan transpeptidase YkuD (ErfK/YbiS/YcfS/YnhG family)
MSNRICLSFLSLLLCISTYAQNGTTAIEKYERILEANKQLLTDKDQLLIVFSKNDTSNKAVLAAFEKRGGRWQVHFNPVVAGIGKTGFARIDEKREGDNKTPSGLFALGQLFTYESSVKTALSFTRSTADDKWIDDPSSAEYNTYVRGNTMARSFEHLLLKSIDYKYCMVIEYNTMPVVKGKGSAIFFHLADAVFTPTAGCVAIQEKDMLRILQWLRPGEKKAILMGTEQTLMAGVKK